MAGMCDMSGNVWEWTSTEQSGDRFYRGGSWLNVKPEDLRASARAGHAPTSRIYDLGFRCARPPQ